MAFDITDLSLVYSGGAANTAPALSLGGDISTAGAKYMVSQITPAPVVISGVTVINTWGNPIGNGTLYWNPNNSTLSWREPNGGSFNGKIISGDGVYTLGSTAGFITVNVVELSLPVAETTETLSVIGNNENLFDSVDEATSLVGNTFYRCLYLLNNNAVDTAPNVRVWIDTNTPAGDNITMALSNSGINTAAEGPLVDQEDSTDVLSSLIWIEPATYATSIIIGNLPPTQYYGIWFRQNIPQETRGTVLDNSCRIAIAADV